MINNFSEVGQTGHNRWQEQIARAKELLSLPDLMEELGDGDSAAPSALCPFHDDHSPSFSVFMGANGDWFWKCHAGCGQGDQISFLEIKLDVTRGDAIRMFLEMAGLLNVGGGRFAQ